MVVTQPTSPGHTPLPSTRDELLKIEGCVPSEFLVKLGDPNDPASVESVLAHLQSSSIVHLACHGKQDMNRPLDGALILEDGQELKISRIMALPCRAPLWPSLVHARLQPRMRTFRVNPFTLQRHYCLLDSVEL